MPILYFFLVASYKKTFQLALCIAGVGIVASLEQSFSGGRSYF